MNGFTSWFLPSHPVYALPRLEYIQGGDSGSIYPGSFCSRHTAISLGPKGEEVTRFPATAACFEDRLYWPEQVPNASCHVQGAAESLWVLNWDRWGQSTLGNISLVPQPQPGPAIPRSCAVYCGCRSGSLLQSLELTGFCWPLLTALHLSGAVIRAVK